MALILGIDQSISNTGLALYDTSAPMSAMRLHSFKTPGRTEQEQIEKFGSALDQILRDWKPDFAALERPPQHIQTFKKTIKDLNGEREIDVMNPHMAFILHQVLGSAIRGLQGRKIPRTVVPPDTWRNSFLGYCKRKDRDAAGFKDWKKAARAQCERFNIPARNMDQAEAAGIAVWASGCDAWKLLKARAA